MNDLNPVLGSMKTNWIKWFCMFNGQVHLSGRIGTGNMATYPPTTTALVLFVTLSGLCVDLHMT